MSYGPKLPSALCLHVWAAVEGESAGPARCGVVCEPVQPANGSELHCHWVRKSAGCT